MNTIYFVPNAVSGVTEIPSPQALEVTSVSPKHFCVPGYSFRYTPGQSWLGECRAGRAYESKTAYETAAVTCESWKRFRDAIERHPEPPAHLTGLAIYGVEQLLFPENKWR
jgi:hypothetical protein